MGDRLTGEDDPSQTESRSYGDIFDEFFPEYLVMGMTPEQYWDGESSLKPAFRKAFKTRMEMEDRIADRNNWYLGQYMIKVLQAVPLLVGGLNVKPSTQLPDYPERPFLEQAQIEKKEELRKKHQEDQTMLALAMFQAGIAKFNKRFEKEQSKPETSGQ